MAQSFPPAVRHRWPLLATLLVLTGLATAGSPPPARVGGSTDTVVSRRPPVTLTVLAGSELSDIEPLLPELAKATNVTLKLEKVGTLEGAEKLINGAHYDLAWFSTASYLNLLAQPGGPGRPVAAEITMLSPVVLGVKTSVADRFGWAEGAEVTWADIAEKARTGQLRYAMTDPAKSNSGFSALAGAATAFAGTGAALRDEDIDEAKLAGFLAGHTLPASSSEWLKDAYLNSQDELDAMVNYESVLLQLNASLREKLRLIYPKDGVVTAEYPLLLLSADRRDDYRAVVNWLRSNKVQARIMAETARRPVSPVVPLDARFPRRVVAELPFPATFDVCRRLISVYQGFRRPAHVIYVLDVSGSMAGQRLQDLRKVFDDLAGGDTSISGQFNQFRKGEKVTVIPFSERVVNEHDFVIADPSPGSAEFSAIRVTIGNLHADGWTAIYSAVQYAYTRAARAGGDYLTTIVLLTDGENNRGIGGQELLSWYRSQPPEVQRIRTFAIRFGEANPAELRLLTDATRGRLFDATSLSLGAAFKEIRGYQ